MIDHELIDSGDGRRLERFGKYVLDRPDPAVMWKRSLPASDWQKADAVFNKRWSTNSHLPEKWQITAGDLKFWLKLTPFKHTGIFPEQSWQWDFIAKTIKEAGRPVNLLNLFAYTGASTMFAAHAGARVTHVDASKPAISWANENRALNNLTDAPIRWIVDDALTFTNREHKRGAKYDAVVMDPPVYGHGPTGKPWSFTSDFPKLLDNCKKILSPNPLFVLVNAYAVSISASTLQNALADAFGHLEGSSNSGELTLKEKSAGRILSTGKWARYTS